MNEVPDILIIVDIKREATAIKEALAKNIPTVAIVDTNCDPTLIDYPIPMNDDASRALEYVLDLFKDAIKTKKAAKSKKSGGSKSKVKDKKTK